MVTAKAPWLGDEKHIGIQSSRFAFDLEQCLHVDQLGQVEAKSIDMVLSHPVEDVLDDEAAHHRCLGPHIIPAATEVAELVGLILPEVVFAIQSLKHVRLANVIVDNIKNDTKALTVQLVYHALEFIVL